MQPDKTFQQFGLGSAYVVYGRYGSKTEVDTLIDPGTEMPYAQRCGIMREAKQLLGERIEYGKERICFYPHFLRASGQVSGFYFSGQSNGGDSKASSAGDGWLCWKERWSDAEATYRNAADIQEAKLGTVTESTGMVVPRTPQCRCRSACTRRSQIAVIVN